MDDDDQLRWGLAIILGGCFALFPLLTGSLDLATTLTIWAIGAIAILPVWRYAGAPVSTPMAAIAFLSLVGGIMVIGWLFSASAIIAYLGAWGGTLATMRFLTHWRDISMTPESGPSWSRRLWALYWLFVATAVTAAAVLNIALASRNLPLAAAVVGLGLAAFVVGLILWALRFLRRR